MTARSHYSPPKKQFGVIFGNESHGISPEILAVASQTFFIPGDGAESLNVSVAAGIALYHFVDADKIAAK
ncbi:hypothetical protein MASR2M18_22040 [Ignavibacteria bacterium]